MSHPGFKIVVYELHPETMKLKRVAEYARDPKTKKCFTRSGATEFGKHLFAHAYNPEKYESYVEPISCDNASARSFMRSARAKSKSHKSRKLRRVGVSRKCHKCDKCGRTGLRQTCVMEGGDGARFHYGSECAKTSRGDRAETGWYSYQDWIKDVEDRVVDEIVSGPTPVTYHDARKLFTEHKRKTSEALLERWKAHEPPFSVALDISETLLQVVASGRKQKHALAMKEFKSARLVPTKEGMCLDEMIKSGLAKNQREAFYLCVQAQQAGIAPSDLVKRIKGKRSRWLVPVGLGVGMLAGYGIAKTAGVV